MPQPTEPRVIVPGLVAWVNSQGILCIDHHYLAHPGRRDPKWATKESAKYLDGKNGVMWRREQEMDPSARAGDLLFRGFDFTRNVVANDSIEVIPQMVRGQPSGWYHFLGGDPGGAVPAAAVFVANRPSPTWTHPEKGVLPILTDGQWVAYAETYAVENRTREFKLAIYREAMIHLGATWVPLQDSRDPGRGFIFDAFCDPSGHQFRLDMDQADPVPLRWSIGAPKLDERLNSREYGLGLMNGLYAPQRDCCGLRYYVENQPCERCGAVGPCIPGLVITERCQFLIKQTQIAVLKKPKFDSEEAKTKTEKAVPQHAPDALRYALVGATTVVPRQRDVMAPKRVEERDDAFGAGFLAYALEDIERAAERFDGEWADLTMEAGDPDA